MERIGVALSSAIGVCLAGSFLKCYPELSMKYVWFRELLKHVAVSDLYPACILFSNIES